MSNRIVLNWSDIPVWKDQLKETINIEIIDKIHRKVAENLQKVNSNSFNCFFGFFLFPV